VSSSFIRERIDGCFNFLTNTSWTSPTFTLPAYILQFWIETSSPDLALLRQSKFSNFFNKFIFFYQNQSNILKCSLFLNTIGFSQFAFRIKTFFNSHSFKRTTIKKFFHFISLKKYSAHLLQSFTYFDDRVENHAGKTTAINSLKITDTEGWNMSKIKWDCNNNRIT
jgi:hypothetical protein